MNLKAALVLLVWIAPLVTPLLPAHSVCEAACCVAAEDLCHQESSNQDCTAMTEGIAGHPNKEYGDGELDFICFSQVYWH